MFESKKSIFDKEGKKYVEFHTIKKDGCGFHMIIEQEAFKKLSQKKLQMLKNIMTKGD